MCILNFITQIAISAVILIGGWSNSSENTKPNPFIGTWRLVTIEYRAGEEVTGYPFGMNTTGYITYTEDGYMFAMLQNNDREEFPFSSQNDKVTGTKSSLRKEFVSYCGKYEIAADKVIHHIEISFFTDWHGPSQRIFEFSGNKLTLSTNPFKREGKETRTVAVWEKVKQ